MAIKDLKNRKATLAKYVPNVSDSLINVLKKVDEDENKLNDEMVIKSVVCSEDAKKLYSATKVMTQIKENNINAGVLKRKLMTFIQKFDANEVEEDSTSSKKYKLHLTPLIKDQQIYKIVLSEKDNNFITLPIQMVNEINDN